MAAKTRSDNREAHKAVSVGGMLFLGSRLPPDVLHRVAFTSICASFTTRLRVTLNFASLYE